MFFLLLSLLTLTLVFIFTRALIEEFTSDSSLIFKFAESFIEDFTSVSSLLFVLPQLLLKNLPGFFSNLRITAGFIEVYFLLH
jgi:hypothetical protein